MYASFVFYMLMGIKVRDLHIFIKSSYLHVLKFVNVSNKGSCHCSVYDLFCHLFKISFLGAPDSPRIPLRYHYFAAFGSNKVKIGTRIISLFFSNLSHYFPMYLKEHKIYI